MILSKCVLQLTPCNTLAFNYLPPVKRLRDARDVFTVEAAFRRFTPVTDAFLTERFELLTEDLSFFCAYRLLVLS